MDVNIGELDGRRSVAVQCVGKSVVQMAGLFYRLTFPICSVTNTVYMK